jgi:hypothetical protein
VAVPWSRLPSYKLAFMKDQYFSTLSTGFSTWSRIHGATKYDKIDIEHIKRVYSIRVCFSLCTSQRLAEMLLDVRYLVMSAYSDFSSVHELIPDKFAGPYPNFLCRWLVTHLSKKMPLIMSDFVTHVPFVPVPPVFNGVNRNQNSLGGDVDLMSLWSGERIKDIQDLFDELFIYVHTLK